MSRYAPRPRVRGEEKEMAESKAHGPFGRPSRKSIPTRCYDRATLIHKARIHGHSPTQSTHVRTAAAGIHGTYIGLLATGLERQWHWIHPWDWKRASGASASASAAVAVAGGGPPRQLHVPARHSNSPPFIGRLVCKKAGINAVSWHQPSSQTRTRNQHS